MAGVVLLAIEERDGDIGASRAAMATAAPMPLSPPVISAFCPKLAMAAIAVLAVVRPRLHLRGLAGEGLLLGGEGRAW